MTQNLFHNPSFNPPPNAFAIELPILAKLKESYELWHSFLPHLPRLTRYTLGLKIDNLFTALVEISLEAKYAKTNEKINLLLEISKRLDNLKYFTMILWEVKGIKNNEYGQIASRLTTIGKMLGGWIKDFQNRNKFTDQIPAP
ncbi:MAG: four helix bundle protein [bacterium]